MLEKPDIPDDTLIACLGKSYGITTAALDFLPIGNDSSAWVYRVRTGNEGDYFLKVKKGMIDPAALLVPRYLKDAGIKQVVAPLPGRSGALWHRVDGFNLVLYPFIAGEVGMEVGLSAGQRREYGAVVQRLHESRLTADLLGVVPRETFVPRWAEMVKGLQVMVDNGRFENGWQQELASFWQERREEIGRLVAQAEELGRMLQGRPLAFVLCHADIHTANILLDGDNLFIVDWDQPILAPKERDLMFVVGDGVVRSREEELFFEGYGETAVDWLAVAYYRYEWVVQEIGDFGERVFLLAEVSDITREDSVRGFRQLFRPGDVVEQAYQAEGGLRPGLGD
jgi:spectinomycin phosphotransferase